MQNTTNALTNPICIAKRQRLPTCGRRVINIIGWRKVSMAYHYNDRALAWGKIGDRILHALFIIPFGLMLAADKAPWIVHFYHGRPNPFYKKEHPTAEVYKLVFYHRRCSVQRLPEGGHCSLSLERKSLAVVYIC